MDIYKGVVTNKEPEYNTIRLLKTAILDLETSFFRADKEGVYRFIIEKAERILIEHILNQTGGNKLQAAKILGINRNTLHAKIKKLGIRLT